MKDDVALLKHIRDAIHKIDEYTEAGRDRFLADQIIQDAVIRNIEIIGEASKGISESTKSKHPQIPWKQIAGMRDFLIHAYFHVKTETVWQTVESDLPSLKVAVDRELAEIEQAEIEGDR